MAQICLDSRLSISISSDSHQNFVKLPIDKNHCEYLNALAQEWGHDLHTLRIFTNKANEMQVKKLINVPQVSAGGQVEHQYEDICAIARPLRLVWLECSSASR